MKRFRTDRTRQILLSSSIEDDPSYKWSLNCSPCEKILWAQFSKPFGQLLLKRTINREGLKAGGGVAGVAWVSGTVVPSVVKPKTRLTISTSSLKPLLATSGSL